MEIDITVMKYLHEYGNTRENDLVDYLEKEFGYSDRHIKDIIGRIERAGNIFRVVHDKLKPPAVYIGLNPKAEALFSNSDALPRTFKAIDELVAKLFEDLGSKKE